MFAEAALFTSDLSSWKIQNSSVVDMRGMFYNALSFNSNLGDWDVSSVQDMGYMFDCDGIGFSSFKGIGLQQWGDLVYKVEDMDGMFNDSCHIRRGYYRMVSPPLSIPSEEPCSCSAVRTLG